MQASAPQPTNRKPINWGSVTLHGVLILAAFVVSIPVIWMILSSLKAESDLVTETLQILPPVVMWDNYIKAFTEINFWLYFRNSVVLSVLFATLTVITSSMAGYAFARIPGFGRAQLFAIVVGLILIPAGVYIVPQFILFTVIKRVFVDLIGSKPDILDYLPWILLGLGGSPFHIFLFRQFFTAFPKELEEAAEIDGAGIVRIFVQIILPNSFAILATSFILNFMVVWGDFILPLLYLSDRTTTLSAVLAGAGYTNQQGYPITSLKLAGSVLYMTPPIVIFFLMQRYIMQGIVTSGLKG